MPITGSSDFRLNCYILKEKKTMKYFIVRPKAKPVRRNRRKSARKLLGLSMTAGLVLLVGSAGALDCGAIPAGQAFVPAAAASRCVGQSDVGGKAAQRGCRSNGFEKALIRTPNTDEGRHTEPSGIRLTGIFYHFRSRLSSVHRTVR